ncbi:MAG TPA: chromate transporter [Firmicutes bacterium]|jgi:chromate transporter|nr:chromate transporter [Bacillota bacterium]
MKRPGPPPGKIFLAFLKIGAFTFGGGYAMLPLIRETVVEREKWVSDEGFLDIISLTQSVPGALAVNTAVFIGRQLAGVPGALAATAGAVLPSFLIILAVAAFFIRFSQHPLIIKVFMGIRPAVVGLIAYAVILLGKKVIRARARGNGFTVAVASGAFTLVYWFGLNPFLVIIAAAGAGLLYSFFSGGGDGQ